MAKDKHHDVGPQQRYKWGGFGSVWKWAKGHGIHRWIKARNWARRKIKQVKDPEGFKKAEEVYAKKVKWFREHKHEHPADGKLIVMFDGKPCAKWMADIASKARAADYWHGTLLSGVRTVAESIALCQHICGHDSCPGLCAGASTNHTCPPTHTCKEYEGAGDFTDAARLCAFARAHGVPLHGGGEFLPNDVNHCSYSGR